jgi:predicted glycosyltransferase involved in capsule biosynthesis
MIISTVTPIKIFRDKKGNLSRSIDRIERQLQSLRAQKTAHEIRPVISDMTEERDIQNRIKEMAKQFEANYIHTPSNLLWNKSFCLNVGIKRVDPASDFIATLDVDIIFREDVFEKCVELARKDEQEKPVVICRSFGHEKEDIKPVFTPEAFNAAKNYGEFLMVSANGGIQFFDREWLYKVRGYDERYNLWGGIDNEIIKRARKDEKKVSWLSSDDDEVFLIHLNHAKWPMPGVNRGFLWNYRKQVNHQFYHREKINVIVNPNSWGDEKQVAGPRLIKGRIKVASYA